jgi:hypothetical protein
MRTRLILVAAVLLLGCDRGERAELERQNAELKAEKAELEKALAESRAELAKLQAAEKAAEAAPTGKQIEATLQGAQDAYVRGEYAHAIELAKQTIEVVPTKSWRIIGAANCFLHDKASAKQAFDKLERPDRSFLKYVCARNSIELD